MRFARKKRYRLKCVYIRAKRREMNSLERRRIRIYIYRSRKMFLKEVIESVESFSRIKDGNGRLALGVDYVRNILKEYYIYYYIL